MVDAKTSTSRHLDAIDKVGGRPKGGTKLNTQPQNHAGAEGSWASLGRGRVGIMCAQTETAHAPRRLH
jgi:hypothetical protein